MDALRAALIIGGVFFHAALPYRAGHHWNVQDPSPYAFFDELSVALAAFRMPTFFFVAGFFCALGFAARDVHRHLLRRLLSFGLPLLAMMALVLPLQYLMRLGRQGPATDRSLDELLQSYFASGAYISHLWFLVHLLLYYLLAWALLQPGGGAWLRRRAGRLGAAMLQGLPRWLQGCKLVLALGCMLLVLPLTYVLARCLPAVPGLSIQDLLRYLPFFAIGFLCFESAAVLQAMSEFKVLDWLVLLVLAVLDGFVPLPVPWLARLVHELAFFQLAWVMGMLLVGLTRCYLDRPHALARAVSEASYTIYLFHHVLVIALATLLLQVAVPGGHLTKYVLVVGGACALSFLLHRHVIRRHGWLSLMFNGRRGRALVS